MGRFSCAAARARAPPRCKPTRTLGARDPTWEPWEDGLRAETVERPARSSRRSPLLGLPWLAAACLLMPTNASLGDAGYLTVADQLTQQLGPLWSERLQRYDAGFGTTTQVNADLLLVHSAAALARYDGPAR